MTRGKSDGDRAVGGRNGPTFVTLRLPRLSSSYLTVHTSRMKDVKCDKNTGPRKLLDSLGSLWASFVSVPPTVHRSPCSLFTPPQGPRFPCPFPHHTRGAFRRSPLTPGTGPSPAPLVLPPVGLSLRSRPPVGRTAPRVSVTREGAGPPVKRASRETDGLWLVPLSLTTCLSSL